MKQFFKTPMLSLIMLVLTSGAGICWEWMNGRVFLLVSPFLFFLVFLAVLVRQRLRNVIRGGVAVDQAKAGHVS
jgi:uncharacterized membrane protein